MKPTILEVMTAPRYLGRFFQPAASWVRWRAFLSCVFALPLLVYDPIVRHHAQRPMPTTRPKQVWLPGGRQSGKSKIVALIAAYVAVYHDFQPKPGDTLAVLILARDREQAGVIMRYIRSFLEGVPEWKRLILYPPGRDQTSKQEIALSNGVSIVIRSSNLAAVRSPMILCALCDEIAFWPTSVESASPDVEVVKAVEPGMLNVPESVLLGISSPWAKRGVLWENTDKYFGTDDARVFVWKAATVEMNPTPQARKEVEAAYKKDPVWAAGEYGGEFRDDLVDFAPIEVIERAIVKGRVECPPEPDVLYYAFVDPAAGGPDSYALAIAGRKGSTCFLACLGDSGPRCNPQAVTAHFAEIVKHYRCAYVTGDNYAKDWPQKEWSERNQMPYVVSPIPRPHLFLALLAALNSGQVELLDSDVLRSQLRDLRRSTKAGREIIEHPSRGHDDLANAAAGALWLASQRSGVRWEEYKSPMDRDLEALERGEAIDPETGEFSEKPTKPLSEFQQRIQRAEDGARQRRWGW